MRRLVLIAVTFGLAIIFLNCTENAITTAQTEQEIGNKNYSINMDYEGLTCTSDLLVDKGSYCLLAGDMKLDKRDPNIRQLISCCRLM